MLRPIVTSFPGSSGSPSSPNQFKLEVVNCNSPKSLASMSIVGGVLGAGLKTVICFSNISLLIIVWFWPNSKSPASVKSPSSSETISCVCCKPDWLVPSKHLLTFIFLGS